MGNKINKSSLDWLMDELVNRGLLVTKDINNLVAYNKSKEMHEKQAEIIFECGRNYQLTGEGTFKEVYREIFGNKEKE